MQPLPLRTRHMPTKITKPPKKGKGAEYDRPQQKKDWKKDESVVDESPDIIGRRTGNELSWGDDDALPFGYYRGKFYISPTSETHFSLGDRVSGGKKEISRWGFKYPGRIWVDNKIFSLWQYPTNVADWKRLIADLSSKTHKNIRKDFKVEMAKTFGKGSDDRKEGSEKIIKVSKLMDKLEGKSGKKVVIPQHSKDTQNLKHLKSPMVKGNQIVPMGMGSKKRPAGLPYSQYHQKMRTGDSVIRLGKLVESILKVRRIRLLVEQMIKEGALGNWYGYFAVGPDAKFIPVGSGEMQYHGDVLKKYPALRKKAVALFGGEGQLYNAVEAGEEKLYKFMYDNGFIRGGRYWVAFDPHKAPFKSLMTVLQLAKENNIKEFNVELGISGPYTSFTVEEFVEKFL